MEEDRRRITLALAFALVILVGIVFGQTVHHQFVNYDDDVYVYQNPVVAHGLTVKGALWVFTHSVNVNWHPLTMLSYMLDAQLYGVRPAGFHLTNVLLHAAASVVLFFALARLTNSIWSSGFVAAVFAIHPLHVESVAWISERKDVLSGLFFALALLAYEHYSRKAGYSLGCYLIVLVCFALGLMAKPMLVTFPLILFLLDYWPLRRAIISRRVLLEKVPLVILSAAACVAALVTQSEAIEWFPLGLRLSNGLVSYAIYLGRTIWPGHLVAYYVYPEHGVAAWEVGGASILLGIITIASWLLRKRQPWLIVGWLWYLIMLLPVIGIIQSGVRGHADRYTYLPQIGVCIMATWTVAGWKWLPRRHFVLWLVGIGVLVSLAVGAAIQASCWRTSETLWHHALALGPDNAMPHLGLGNFFLDEKRPEAAIYEFKRAIEFKPDYAEPHVSLGLAYERDGEPERAIEEFRRAISLKPDYALAHGNLANALAEKGEAREAIADWERALALKPHDVRMQNDLAWLLATWPDVSIRDGARAVRLAEELNGLTGRDDPIILRTLAAAYAEAGQFSAAVETARRALGIAVARSNPDLANRLRRELHLFESGIAYREPPP